MCLRFLLEANAENQQIVRELEARQVVPSEVLDKRAYETFIDLSGRVGLRRKGGAPIN
jgi:palmitoyltransferase